jgi:O-methyltransferase involved in polyketide biosynthesis
MPNGYLRVDLWGRAPGIHDPDMKDHDMTAEKVTLTKEKETLLITLYGKAEESRLPDSLLKDHFAAEAVSRIDYDFSRLRVRYSDMIGLAMRAHLFDSWTRAFIAKHPDATVVHLGCGLDSRVFRLDPPAGVRWFDLDFPEVIALRRRLYPTRPGYHLIASSVTDSIWLDVVPKDRPAMIIAEGLLPYLGEEEVPRLFKRLTAHFLHGEVAFDGYSQTGLRLLRLNPSIRATGAELHWSIDDPHELEGQVPRLRFVSEYVADDPKLLARFPWPMRVTLILFQAIPTLRRLGRFLHYRF